MKLYLHVILLFFFKTLFAQITLEYQSQFYPYNSISGWLPFMKNTSWEYRFYYLDSTKFQIYSSAYNGVVQYTYNFTQPEINAGGYIYSLGVDLTGDNIVEFYVLGLYGTTSNPRQSVKILDITNNSVLLELNSANYYYSAPTLYDIDNDGTLEMIFVEYDMANNYRYRLLAYNTNVSLSSTDLPFNKTTEVFQNFPNPFNQMTTIRFNLFQPEKVRIEILNINGELIKNLTDQIFQSGMNEIYWDGTNELNQRVASGVYFYRILTNGNEISKKLLLLK